MNAAIVTKLEKYMKTDGMYDVAAIRADFPGDERAVFNSLWADDGDSANDDPNAGDEFMSEEWRFAVKHNENVIKQTELTVDQILAKSDDNITNNEWLKLMDNGYATTHIISSPWDDMGQDTIVYKRTSKQVTTELFSRESVEG